MARSIFYRWYGVGKFPAAMMPQIEVEGIGFFEDGVGGSVTYRNFHRPGKYASYERRGLSGSVVLTKTRLLALWGPNKLIDVPLSDERLRSMQFTVDDGVFCVSFDAALFHSDWSGSVEYRFKLDEAWKLAELLKNAIA